MPAPGWLGSLKLLLRDAKRSELQGFLELLDGKDDLLKEFAESLWLGLVRQMKVQSETGFTFVLKDGRVIIWAPKKTNASIANILGRKRRYEFTGECSATIFEC